MLDAWGEHAFTIHSVSGCVYSTVVGCIILMLCGVYTDEAELVLDVLMNTGVCVHWPSLRTFVSLTQVSYSKGQITLVSSDVIKGPLKVK